MMAPTAAATDWAEIAALYDRIDDNPQFAFLDAQYVNAGHVIRQNPRVVAVNSAIEVDLTGQVCSDSIGTFQYSGVGGQMDFMRGAALSEGGKPIIALTSTTSKGDSKIVPFLHQGAGVVTTRAHVHYVVTEYGMANLKGRSVCERAQAMIGLAHPDFRDELERRARLKDIAARCVAQQLGEAERGAWRLCLHDAVRVRWRPPCIDRVHPAQKRAETSIWR